MLLYVTIGILFCYTLLLIAFFMGWCTLIPIKCHASKDLPFSVVKSPRRNTIFIEIDSIASSTSIEGFKKYDRKDTKLFMGKHKKNSLPECESRKVNDYLHPKYSLPPVSVDLMLRKWEYETFLRVPGRAVRSESAQEALSTVAHRPIVAEI